MNSASANNSATTEKLPEVTVAVCVRNGEATLTACLESLLNLDYPEGRCHILVVDNGSTDGTPRIINEYDVSFVHEPEPGRAVARNRAWKECGTPFLAFTDADCRVSSDWLKSVMPLFEDSLVGVAGGPIITPGDESLARFFEKRRIVCNEEFSGNYPFSPPFLATANAVFRKEALDICGGFNPEFIVAEDADVSWRITDAGFVIKYSSEGTVYHHHRTSLSGLFRQSVDYGFDGIAICMNQKEKFKSLPWIWWGLYYRLLISLPKLLFTIFTGPANEKLFPLYDLIRYSGLALGRIKAAVRFRKLVL